MILALGALLGLVSVAFGAYAEHGLKNSITIEQYSFLITAVRYNQIHAIMSVVIGFALLQKPPLSYAALFKLSGSFFVVGTLLFSISIYLSVTFNFPVLVKAAPIGGLTLMLAWFLLVVFALLNRKVI